MDLKSFSDNNFDPKKWINKAWSSNANQDKEVFVANTVSRLQLYMKQLANSLEETTTQIRNSVPRILQDASALGLQGAILQQQLVSLRQKVEDVQQETGHSIESLQRIHALKSALENAASALREADKWAALVAALEDMLESGVPTQTDKLTELSQQLTAVTASLEVLSDAPDYEQKRLQLETLYNRLEAVITPPFIEALTQMNAERTATYVSVFAGMSRGVSASRCWRRASAARLAAAWRGQDTHLLSSLTRLLAGEANIQVEWLSNVLQSESPIAELIRLYTDLLLSLEPSPNKVVSANLKLCSSPVEGILLLTDLRTDIEEFVMCIRRVIDAPRNNKETVLPAVVKEFGRAAYSPLRDLLPHYTELQAQLFMALLNTSNLQQQEDLHEKSRSLLSLSERCDGWLSAAHVRAVNIANMAVYPYFVPAVETFVSAISNMFSSHARHIESSFLSSMRTDGATGVLSNTFPATLVLESAVSELLRVVSEQTDKYTWEDVKDQYPLEDIPLVLLEKEARDRLPSYRESPLSCCYGLQASRDQLKSLAKAILRSPVDAQLDKIPQLSVWSNNDAMSTELPDYALSPQEYITEIGQYLMTLPQHLEMHLSEKQAPWQFLNDVCTHTCDEYAQKILNIRNMDALGTKRCLTDIVYLSSVVEDLGTNVTPSLKNLEKSLRSTAPQQGD